LSDAVEVGFDSDVWRDSAGQDQKSCKNSQNQVQEQEQQQHQRRRTRVSVVHEKASEHTGVVFLEVDLGLAFVFESWCLVLLAIAVDLMMKRGCLRLEMSGVTLGQLSRLKFGGALRLKFLRVPDARVMGRRWSLLTDLLRSDRDRKRSQCRQEHTHHRHRRLHTSMLKQGRDGGNTCS